MRNKILITLFLLAPYLIKAQESFSLKQAIDYAIKENAASKLVDLDVRKAEAEISEFKSIGMPQVNAGIDYTHYFYVPSNPVEDFITPSIYGVLVQEFPGQVTPPTGDPEIFEFSIFTKNNLTAKVDASMLLFDGSYLTGLKAAKQFRELTKKKKAIKEEEIRAGVTKAYMNVLIAEENQKTLNNNIKTITKSLSEAEAYYESGFIEHLEVKRLNLSKESLTTEITKIEKLILLSKDLLKFQMSYPMNDDIELDEDLNALVDKFSAEDVDLDDTTIDFNNKAQYAEIEMGQQLNELNIERLERGFLPSLMARAGASESLQRNKLFDSNENGWIPTLFAGLSLNIPITDGRKKKSLIQQAEIEAERISLQKAEFERGITMQVQTSKLQYASAKETYLNAKKILELNEDIFETTQIKFSEGVGSSLEVTQAESDLFAAQSAYINALYQLLITKTDLDIALGNL